MNKEYKHLQYPLTDALEIILSDFQKSGIDNFVGDNVFDYSSSKVNKISFANLESFSDSVVVSAVSELENATNISANSEVNDNLDEDFDVSKYVWNYGSEESKITVFVASENSVGSSPFNEEEQLLFSKMFDAIGEDSSSFSFVVIKNFYEKNEAVSNVKLNKLSLYVKELIKEKSSKIIIAVGQEASKIVVSKPVMEARVGNELLESIPVCAIFHPSFLLNKSAFKKMVWHDLLKLKNKLVRC